MANRQKEKDQYAKTYTETQKWLNQCVICQTTGYKPAMPENSYPNRLFHNIRKQYPPLFVNELSICEDCAKNWIK